jgi:Tfp pilus assembly protein PilW
MNDERGFLLTELTVTIALLVVVLAVGFIFFFLCQRSFYEGEKKTIVQSNVRLAANYITKEVRYADNISATDMSGVKNHCLELDGNNLKKVTKESDGSIQTQTQTITRDDCLTGLSFSVGADSERDLGKVMGVLMPKVKGRADGKLVNQVVRELLTSGH